MAASLPIDGGGGAALWTSYPRLAGVDATAVGATLGPHAGPVEGTATGQVGLVLAGSAGRLRTLRAATTSLRAFAIGFPGAPVDIPARVLAAYRAAAGAEARIDPGCHLTWPLLAGIGKIESGHARGGAVDATDRTLSPILGPVLSGGGFAAIRDTDNGRYDGNTSWDRAVGPMQFIPSSWGLYGRDGDGDGRADPHNVYDAALASAAYLCAGSRDLRDTSALGRAVFGYNHSWDYVATVLAWMQAYAGDGGVGPGTAQDDLSSGLAGTGVVVAATRARTAAATVRPPHPTRSATPTSTSTRAASPTPLATAVVPAANVATPTPLLSPTPTGCPTDVATGPTPTSTPTDTPTPTNTAPPTETLGPCGTVGATLEPTAGSAMTSSPPLAP